MLNWTISKATRDSYESRSIKLQEDFHLLVVIYDKRSIGESAKDKSKWFFVDLDAGKPYKKYYCGVKGMKDRDPDSFSEEEFNLFYLKIHDKIDDIKKMSTSYECEI